MAEVKASLSAMAQAIGAAVAPAVTNLAQLVTTNIGHIIDWIRENERLVIAMGSVAAAATGLAAALALLGGAATGASAAIKGLGVALTFLKAHPYIAAAAALTAVVAALAAKFGLFSDSVEDATEKQTALTDATNTATEAIAKQQSAVSKLERINALQKELAGLRRANVFEQVGQTREQGLANNAQRIKEVEDELRVLRGFGRRSLSSPFATPAGGFNHFLAVLPDLPLRGRGRPGFDILETQARRNIGAISQGTFSGRLASQIFGGGQALSAGERRIVKKQEETVRLLQSIDRKMGPRGVGPAFKVGLA
jgi:hypothetical protein